MQLVINSFGASLNRNGELFKIVVADRKVEVAARKIQSILITTSVHFTSDAILLAIEHNIDVVLLDKYGKPFGRFWNGTMGSTSAIRRHQLKMAESYSGLLVIKEWTKIKLENQKEFLLELQRRRPGKDALFIPNINRIENAIVNLESVDGTPLESAQKIMGLEGTAGAAYWSVIGQLPPGEFQTKKRSKHPALDPLNAMINYGYGVLYAKVERACIIAGLDPYTGFVHTDNYNKKSLVFDLIELFRIFVDRTVLKLFTGRRCKKQMFRKDSSGAVILEKDAKELLLNNLNEYLAEKVRYKVKSSKKNKTRQIKRLDTIQSEAHTLANRILGKDINHIPKIIGIEELFQETS